MSAPRVEVAVFESRRLSFSETANYVRSCIHEIAIPHYIPH